MTSESISATTELIRFGSRGTMDGDECLPDGYPMSSMEVNAGATGELVAGEEDATKHAPL